MHCHSNLRLLLLLLAFHLCFTGLGEAEVGEHTRALVYESGIVGYIGTNNLFWLAAPVIPTAEGPNTSWVGNSDFVTVTWTWQFDATQVASPYADALPPRFRHEWGGVAGSATMPQSTQKVTVRLPSPFRVREKAEAYERHDQEQEYWAVFAWYTDASPPRKADRSGRTRPLLAKPEKNK